MSARITRRLSITVDQVDDDAVVMQLYTTFAAYGTVECITTERSSNYGSVTVQVQFQKLSSAERLHMDADGAGRRQWRVQYMQAVPHVGRCLLLSSRVPVPEARVHALLHGEKEKHHAGGDNGAHDSASPCGSDGATATVMDDSGVARPTLEAKAARVPGSDSALSSMNFSSTDLSSTSTATAATTSVWGLFVKAVTSVRQGSVGPHVMVLRFETPQRCNAFLVQHQRRLAEELGICAVHAGPATGELSEAIEKLLPARKPTSLSDGDILRGFIVSVANNASCLVDAGLTSEKEERAVLLDTHSNFLKVSVGDEVLVRVTLDRVSATVLSGSGSFGNEHVKAVLHKIIAGAPVARGGSRQQQSHLSRAGGNPNILDNNLRSVLGKVKQLSMGSAGAQPHSRAQRLAMAAAVRQQQQQQPEQLGQGPAGSAASKEMASKLFKLIQAKKASGALGPNVATGAVNAERVYVFPAGLHMYTQLLVKVESIAADGLHASCISVVEDADSTSASRPVNHLSAFIPAALVPVEDGGSGIGGDWRCYAVVGEKMTVSLLYVVAVGGSAATLRCVASKSNTDLCRRPALPASVSAATAEVPDEVAGGTRLSTGGEHDADALVGTAFQGVPAFTLTTEDVGVAAGNSHFPAVVVRLSASSPLLVFMARARQQQQQTSSSSGDALVIVPLSSPGAPRDPITMVDLVVSECVNDSVRGRYVVALPAEEYAAAEASKDQAIQAAKEAELEKVRKRLAAVLGEATVNRALGDTGDVLKRPKLE